MIENGSPIIVSSANDRDEWDGFVNAHPQATGYHLWAWRNVFEGAFGHTCDYLAARRNGRMIAVLPLVNFRSWLFGRFAVSLPFVNYGGVLASDDAAARALVEHAGERARRGGAKHVELRHRQRVFDDLPIRQHKVAMLLRLASTPDAMWEAFDRKVRNQVRKAEKSGLSVESGGADLLGEFYRTFTENMRDLGTPVYSRRFFRTILETFPERTRVLVARREGRAVAGAISFRYRRTVEVPWAASLREFRPLCPNHLLYWTAIREGIGSGMEIFDFGRSTPGEGTYQFKRQWGAEAHPLHWEYRLVARSAVPDQSPKNPRFKLAIEAWKRLPLRVTLLVGPPIVRGIP